MTGGGENRAVVILENGEPVRAVIGMVLARFERQVEVGAQERCAEFGNLS